MTAEESERKALAVEVRVLWGGDLLRVVHLDPPRTFHVGEDGADVAVDAERLGARRFPVVIAGAGGVCVVAPRGATGVIVGPAGVLGPVERAVEEGLGTPYDGDAPGTRIPLAKGVRVSVTLPARSVGTLYRAAGANEAAAPLVLEIALVNAGRVVGRGTWLRGRGRILASVALVTAAAGGSLHLAATQPPPGDDDVDRETVYLMQAAIRAVEEREADAEPEEPLVGDPPRALHGCRGCLPDPWNDVFQTRYLCETMGNDPVASAFFARACEPYSGIVLHGVGDGGGEIQVDAGYGWMGGFSGFGSIGTIGGWHAGAGPGFGVGGRFGQRPARHPRVRGGAIQVSGRLSPDAVQRVVQPMRARFRACYDGGLRNNPNVQGRVAVRFVVDREGAISNVGNGGSDMPDGSVVSCVMRAFYGLRFPPPEAGTATVTYPVRFDSGD